MTPTQQWRPGKRHNPKSAKPHARVPVVLVVFAVLFSARAAGDDAIRPYPANPRYWEYQGAPVLVLGGSKTDHIFLLDDLESHLDEIVAAGGNYVRCTISQREGAPLKPHRLLPDGKFDLDRWNDDYWQRFERCLDLCTARGIIVQIELWDRFDYSQEQWADSAWRPANNINYTPDETGLADVYPDPAHRDKQPFFHTLPGLPLYDARHERILRYQEAFVAKVLAHSLRFGNVLYCINNEGSAPAAWSAYWAAMVHEKAWEAGRTVYVTEMLDQCKLEPVVSRPELYNFVEGSKILGPRRQTWAPKGEGQWQTVLDTFAAMGADLRPINAVKIITNEDAESDRYSRQKFWRGLMAGMGAIRFHRAPAGSALNDSAQACIRATRLLESRMKLWDLEPRLDLLQDREKDEAYLRAKPGEAYVVYFPRGGSVKLDLTNETGTFTGQWIDIRAGVWGETFSLAAGERMALTAPGPGEWVTAIAAAPASASLPAE